MMSVNACHCKHHISTAGKPYATALTWNAYKACIQRKNCQENKNTFAAVFFLTNNAWGKHYHKIAYQMPPVGMHKNSESKITRAKIFFCTKIIIGKAWCNVTKNCS